MSCHQEIDETTTNVTESISCDHYSVLRRENGSITVTTYPNHFDLLGVERHLYENTKISHFYVENVAGKTIDSGRYIEPKKNNN